MKKEKVNPIWVTLKGKANCKFIVKNPDKIELWKKLEAYGMGMFVIVKTEEIKKLKEKGE